MNLFNSEDPSNLVDWLGPYAGYYESGEALPLLRIVGGVNTFYSQLWSITSNNALCHADSSTTPDLLPNLGYYQFRMTPCQIVFENPYSTGRWKREEDELANHEGKSYTGPEHLNPRHWQVKEVRVAKGWEKRSIKVRSSDLDSPHWPERMTHMLNTAEPIENGYHSFTPINSTVEAQLRAAAQTKPAPPISRKHFERHLHSHH
ncbi:hypothetical protein N7454_010500 [Penicillium verhagenii]|nr:hypothetical protein N7454_010500 [Penicillium verhagenii]